VPIDASSSERTSGPYSTISVATCVPAGSSTIVLERDSSAMRTN
jgi:hypothetical protein